MEQRHEKTQFAINVTTGWLGLTVTIAVGIIQLPYLLWRLGPETFGIFQLANSVLSFLIFLQLGMRPTLVRYLSISVSKGDHTEISNVSNTALSILITLGIFGALLISLSSPAFISFYDIPASIHSQTYGLLFCFAGVFFINFLAIVPASILMATQRYDTINITTIIVPIVRITLIIISFELIESSIYILGIIILISQLLRLLLIQFTSARQFGWKPILSLANAQRNTFKKIYKFSFFTFLHSVFNSLVFQGPVFIIGKLLGLEAAGFFAPTRVAAKAISTFMAQVASPLIPLASSARVEQNFSKIGIWSIRICQIMVSIGLFIAFPFCIAGQEITTIWLGEEKVFLWNIIAITAVGTAIARGGTANGSLALGGGNIVPTMVSSRRRAPPCIA